MEIEITNCSSPGAHFSDETKGVIKKIYQWIITNNSPQIPFIDFRRRLENEMKINDNNARNIYPLLKNCGFVYYLPNKELESSKFFTSTGEGLLLGLKLFESIENSDYIEPKKNLSKAEINHLLCNIIFDGLMNLFKNKELNYRDSMRWFLMFLLEFKKIDKKEFAYMVYQMNIDDDKWMDKIRDVISDYRNKKFEIDVKVRVRNDKKIQQKTGQTTRLEGISFFTAFSYYSSLFLQAGITEKGDGNYHYLIPSMKEKVEKLLEV